MQHFTNMSWINDIPLPFPLISMTRPSCFLTGQHQLLPDKADIASRPRKKVSMPPPPLGFPLPIEKSDCSAQNSGTLHHDPSHSSLILC